MSETHGGENQTAGYTNQISGRESPMHRGSREPFDGEILTSGDSSATSGDTGPTSVGWCQNSLSTGRGQRTPAVTP